MGQRPGGFNIAIMNALIAAVLTLFAQHYLPLLASTLVD
jgi:hypothetical protein